MGKFRIFVRNNQISGRIIRQNGRIPDIRCFRRIPDIRFSKSRIPDIWKSGKSQYPADSSRGRCYRAHINNFIMIENLAKKPIKDTRHNCTLARRPEGRTNNTTYLLFFFGTSEILYHLFFIHKIKIKSNAVLFCYDK